MSGTTAGVAVLTCMVIVPTFTKPVNAPWENAVPKSVAHPTISCPGVAVPGVQPQVITLAAACVKVGLENRVKSWYTFSW